MKIIIFLLSIVLGLAACGDSDSVARTGLKCVSAQNGGAGCQDVAAAPNQSRFAGLVISDAHAAVTTTIEVADEISRNEDVFVKAVVNQAGLLEFVINANNCTADGGPWIFISTFVEADESTSAGVSSLACDTGPAEVLVTLHTDNTKTTLIDQVVAPFTLTE